MSLEAFTTKWFALYYPILGIIFLVCGSWLIVKPGTGISYILSRSGDEQPPVLIRTILKYYFMFTIPCLIFAFIPFSWPELLFTFWSFIIIYVVGIQMVHWPQTRQFIKNHPGKVPRVIKMTGAIMVAVSPVMFLLGYLIIKRLTTL